MRTSWVLAAGVALTLGAAPAAHAGSVMSTPITGLSAPAALGAADFDRNGRADLAVVDGTDLVVKLMPQGPTVRVPQGMAPTAVATGDLDRDGRPDVATLSPTALTLNLADADGDWHTTSLPTTGSGLAIGDFAGDGWNDIAVRDADVVRLFIGGPDGDTTTTESVAGTGAIAAGDGDGDGRTDLAVLNGSDVAILLHRADGPGSRGERSRRRPAAAPSRWRCGAMPSPSPPTEASNSSDAPLQHRAG